MTTNAEYLAALPADCAVGWRFGLVRDDGQLWPPYHLVQPFFRVSTAVCTPFYIQDGEQSLHPESPAPHPDCGCGIYACESLEMLADCIEPGIWKIEHGAFYRVVTSGRTFKSPSDPAGTWRSERAEVIGPIFLRDKTLAAGVEATYGVETVIVPTDGSQRGTTPGWIHRDSKGASWWAKRPESSARVANEHLANALYRAAGVRVPQTRLADDGRVHMSKLVPSVDWHELTGKRLREAQRDAAHGFVADAWLANWDAPAGDNVRVTECGHAYRVDAGGALMFRAMGGQRVLLPTVEELQTMRDPGINPDGAILYAEVTPSDIAAGVARVASISPGSVRRLVSKSGLPTALTDVLLLRQRELSKGLDSRRSSTAPAVVVP